MPMMEQKELLNLAQTPTSEFWIFLADFNQWYYFSSSDQEHKIYNFSWGKTIILL